MSANALADTRDPVLLLVMGSEADHEQAFAESGVDDLPRYDFTHFWCRTALSGIGRLAPPRPDEAPVDIQISVTFCDRQAMRSLNRDYREQDKPTNVLSFPSGMPALDTDDGRQLQALGDLCICPAVVVEEAREQGKALRHHWAHLLVHGVLHLCGYDHEGDEQADEMEAIERRVLGEQKLPDPYIGDDSPSNTGDDTQHEEARPGSSTA